MTLVVDATVTIASVGSADGFEALGDEDLVAPALMWSEARSTLHLGLLNGKVSGQVAAVAVARKLAVLAWHLLSSGEDYAFGRPSLLRAKLRKAELAAGAPPLPKRHGGPKVRASASEREAERQLAERGEAAYRRPSRTVANGGAGRRVDLTFIRTR